MQVVNQIQYLAEKQNSTLENLKASYMDVMATTGPGIFAENVYRGLSTASGTVTFSLNSLFTIR